MRVILAVAAAIAIGGFLHNWLDEEAHILRTVKRARAAIGARNLLKLSTLLAVDYRDGLGHDRQQALGMARYAFQEFKDTQLELLDRQVQLRGEEHARVALTVRAPRSMAHGSWNGIVLEGRELPVWVDLVRERTGWKISGWEPRNR